MFIAVDVATNILCIYLQFNFASTHYSLLCGAVDKKFTKRVESAAVQKLRQKTLSFYGASSMDTTREATQDLDAVQSDEQQSPLPLQQVASKSVAADEKGEDLNVETLIDFHAMAAHKSAART